MATRAFSFVIALAMIFGPLGIGPAQSQPQSQLFETRAKQAVMIDAETGTILYSKDADKLIPPASLAKLMTMEVVFHALKVGRLSMDDKFAVSKNAWTKGGAKSGGSTMFAKVNVPILGLIENMAWFEADDGKKYYLFGKEGGLREAAALNVPVLGQIPIDIETRERGDNGAPIALVSPQESKVSAAFHQVAAAIRAKVPV